MSMLFAAQEEKIAFSTQLILTCDKSWVKYPVHFELMNASRSFSIQVDPRGLPEGAHYTEVRETEWNLGYRKGDF